jgi:plasmid stabilization system protein ParE
MRVVWLRRALRNLDEAVAWTARDDPAAAVAVALRI